MTIRLNASILSALLVCTSFLPACTTEGPLGTPPLVQTVSLATAQRSMGPYDPAMTQLAEAATSVSQSLNTLAAIQKARTPAYQKRLPNPATYGMTDIVSLDWSGPVEPLLKIINAGL